MLLLILYDAVDCKDDSVLDLKFARVYRRGTSYRERSDIFSLLSFKTIGASSSKTTSDLVDLVSTGED